MRLGPVQDPLDESDDWRERLLGHFQMRRMMPAWQYDGFDRPAGFPRCESDLLFGRMLVVLALHDQHGHPDTAQLLADIECTELGIEPGIVPAEKSRVGIGVVTREPIDRLQQIIAQSWYWIGGFCAPSDTTTNPTTIPTATNAAFKRAVMIEHVG